MKKILIIATICAFVFSFPANLQAQKVKKVKLNSHKDSLSYAFGLSIADNLQKQKIDSLNSLAIGRAFQDFYNNESKFSVEDANKFIQNYFDAQEADKHKEVINIMTEENYPLHSQRGHDVAPATCFPAMGCAAGTSQLVIDPVGQVFACPFLHEFPVGDLRWQSLSEIWERSELLNAFRHVEQAKLQGKCHTCHYAPTQCRGGCRASAYAVTGDLWAEDPLCWHTGH